MASSQSKGRGIMVRQPKHTWEEWKELVRHEYLVKEQDSKTVAEVLCGYGLAISKKQLDGQLTSWGFRKNVPREGWISIDETIQRREEAGKRSLVLLSGRRVPAEKVESQIARHRPLCKYTAPSPMSPDDDRVVQVCTPRSRSPDPASLEYPWPRTLPWFQFSQSTFNKLLAGIQLIPNRQRLSANLQITAEEEEESETQITLHEFACKEMTGVSKRSHFVTAQCIMRQIIKRTMEIMIGSEKLASLLVASRSVDSMAARFDRIMPESYQGENVDRAIELVKGKYADQQAQLLKMLVYLASNNLIMQESEFVPRQGSKWFLDETAFIGLFRLSGLASEHMLNELVKSSKQMHTLIALIGALFMAAVRVEAADIVISLLTTKHYFQFNFSATVAHYCCPPFSFYSYGRGFFFCTPLDYALRIGAVDLVKALIAGGADVNHRHYDWVPLAIAAFLEEHRTALQLVHILLGYGAKQPHDCRIPSLMQLALGRGNVELVKLLLLRGEDAVSTWHTRRILGLTFDCPTLDYLLPKMKTISSFAFAALANGPVYTSNNHADNKKETNLEIHIISLMELLIAYSKDGTNSLRRAGPAAMIVAAARGHVKVLEFLRSHQPDLAVTATNGKVSPLSAALTTNQVEACRLLLSWGVSTTVDECLRDSWVHRMLSPWHFAVLYDSIELGRLLLRQGANLNPSCIMRGQVQREDMLHFLPLAKRHISPPGFTTQDVSSPLLFAILLCHEEMAAFLISAGALVTTTDLIEATKLGQGKLVAQILDTMIGSSTYSEQQAAVIATAIQHGQLSIAQQVMQGVSADKLHFAAIFILPTVARIQPFLPTATAGSRLHERFEGRSYLETAILGGSAEVITFALSLDLAYYDSGALCAAVSREAGTASPAMKAAYSDAPLVQDLVKRRDALERLDNQIDPCLESTAVAIAVSYGRLDLINHLVSGNGTQAIPHRATLPGFQYWKNNYNGQYIDLRSDFPGANVQFVLGQLNSAQLYLAGLGKWRGWHSSSVGSISPILFAINQQGPQHTDRHTLSEQLLDCGFPVDPYTLGAAMEHDFPEALLAKMTANCIIREAESEMNPLRVAALKGRLRVVESLLEHGASVNPINSHVYGSPLAAAAENGHLEIVQFLLESGAYTEHDIYSRSRWETALQGAARNAHIGVVRCLLAHDADVDAPRNPHTLANRLTALEAAAYRGRLETVALLLHHGVAITGQGRVQYLRAIQLATEHGHTAIAQMLQNARERLPEDDEVWDELHDHPLPFIGFFIHPAEYVDDAALIEAICRIIEFYRVCSHCTWWKGNETTRAKLDAALEIAKGKMEGTWNPSTCKNCEQDRNERNERQANVSDDEQSLEGWDDSSENDQDSSEASEDSWDDEANEGSWGDEADEGSWEDEGSRSPGDGSKSVLAHPASGADVEMHDGTLSTELDISDWSYYQGDGVTTVYDSEEIQDGCSPSACQGGVTTQLDVLFTDHDNDKVMGLGVWEVPKQEQDEEAERRQRILADMRGEREMESEAMDWEW